MIAPKVTDSATGLQWEKKTGAVGSGQNYGDPHDVRNTYTWCLDANTDLNCDNPGNPPDGTACGPLRLAAALGGRPKLPVHGGEGAGEHSARALPAFPLRDGPVY